MDINIRILEHLASKICHDLVSPVGAINNGVELIEDVGGDVTEEAMKLIGDSAEQAARRLRLFRLAYGRAGGETAMTFKDARETIEAFLSGGKVKLSFAPDFPSPGLTDAPGALKIMLNMILLADEALVYGGIVTVGNALGDFSGGATVTATGRGAVLTESASAAFTGTATAETITPRTVQAYVAGKFASCYGFRTAIEATQSDAVSLHFAPA